MDTRSIDQLLGQMRTAAALAAGKPQAAARSAAAQPGGFSAALRSAIEQTSQAQHRAQELARSFSLGEPDVQLHDVMISAQKANISFQQMVQVRNRLVSAYHDIMNMQV
jgi:flagellar hook-basal body complex protein FliE